MRGVERDCDRGSTRWQLSGHKKMQHSLKKDIRNEIAVMEALRPDTHENILRYHGHFHDKNSDFWFLVMEKASGINIRLGGLLMDADRCSQSQGLQSDVVNSIQGEPCVDLHHFFYKLQFLIDDEEKKR